MKTRARFAILVMIPLGCAVEANSPPNGSALMGAGGSGATAGDSVGGSATSGSATGGSSSFAGSSEPIAGTFPVGGTFGEPVGGAGGTFGAGASAGGASGSGGAGGTGTAGKSAGGSGGKASGGTGGTGTAGTGGTPPVTAYCDSVAKSPLPFTTNTGFQPSGWQGDIPAISAANITPDGCAARSANPVGSCSAWRYTPNAVTPAWAGVTWSKVWDAWYTHPNVCLAAGATKVTFQAKGAVGGEQITVSAAGAAEYPFTLTNAWQEYVIPLNGVTYNTFAEGVTSGFFWKVAPPTPGGGAVTFFIDDIQFVQ